MSSLYRREKRKINQKIKLYYLITVGIIMSAYFTYQPSNGIEGIITFPADPQKADPSYQFMQYEVMECLAEADPVISTNWVSLYAGTSESFVYERDGKRESYLRRRTIRQNNPPGLWQPLSDGYELVTYV